MPLTTPPPLDSDTDSVYCPVTLQLYVSVVRAEAVALSERGIDAEGPQEGDTSTLTLAPAGKAHAVADRRV